MCSLYRYLSFARSRGVCSDDDGSDEEEVDDGDDDQPEDEVTSAKIFSQLINC